MPPSKKTCYQGRLLSLPPRLWAAVAHVANPSGTRRPRCVFCLNLCPSAIACLVSVSMCRLLLCATASWVVAVSFTKQRNSSIYFFFFLQYLTWSDTRISSQTEILVNWFTSSLVSGYTNNTRDHLRSLPSFSLDKILMRVKKMSSKKYGMLIIYHTLNCCLLTFAHIFQRLLQPVVTQAYNINMACTKD